jgi:tetratricopeptide (TPR) repeat protein
MSMSRLAVSAGSVLFVLFAFRAVPQTIPSSQTTTVAAAGNAPTPNISQEDLGRLYLVRKQYREAQEIFHQLIVQHPANAIYWNELGISLHSQLDLVAALKCYEKSSKLDKHYADPQNNIGTVYYARKKYPKAIRAYKRALSLKDDSAPFYLNIGYAYFGDKKYEDSMTSFRKALELDPDAFESAKAHSGTVIQDRSISSDRAHFYFLLAKSFAESGNIERCAIYLKKARDEGYQEMNAVNSDPSFAKVIKDPAIQEALGAKAPETVQQ